MSLSKEEVDFLKFWESKRALKNKNYSFIMKGVRDASLLNSLILLTLLTGWYKRVHYLNTGLLVCMFFGLFIVFLFIMFFTYFHNYEKNEQRYQELLTRQ